MPGAPPLKELARGAGVSFSALRIWVETAKLQAVTTPPKPPGRPDDRLPEEKLRVVRASHGLSVEELGAFLPREGVHEADLADWRRALQEGALASLRKPAGASPK